MRCSCSNRTGWVPLLVVFLALAVSADTGMARSKTVPAAAPADSVHVGAPSLPALPAPPTPPEPPGRKRIIIGGSGVRIIDEDSDSTSAGNGQDIIIGKHHLRAQSNDDIVRVGESVYVAPGEVVPGDIVVFGGNAVIEGTVNGSVVVMGGEVRARSGSEIKGDIVAIGGKIVEDQDVVISGEKIVVGGIMSRMGDSLDIGGRAMRAIASGFVLFVSVILFLITMLFLRGRVECASDHLASGFLRSFGAGVLACIVLDFAVAIVTIPLIITLVGIPLAVILLLSYFGLFVISCAVFVHAVGRAIAVRTGVGGGVLGRMLVGFAVLAVPELLAFVVDTLGHGPVGSLYLFLQVVSAVVWLCAYVVGLGAIVLSRFGTRPPVGDEPPPERVGDFVPSPAS